MMSLLIWDSWVYGRWILSAFQDIELQLSLETRKAQQLRLQSEPERAPDWWLGFQDSRPAAGTDLCE